MENPMPNPIEDVDVHHLSNDNAQAPSSFPTNSNNGANNNPSNRTTASSSNQPPISIMPPFPMMFPPMFPGSKAPDQPPSQQRTGGDQQPVQTPFFPPFFVPQRDFDARRKKSRPRGRPVTRVMEPLERREVSIAPRTSVGGVPARPPGMPMPPWTMPVSVPMHQQQGESAGKIASGESLESVVEAPLEELRSFLEKYEHRTEIRHLLLRSLVDDVLSPADRHFVHVFVNTLVTNTSTESIMSAMAFRTLLDGVAEQFEKTKRHVMETHQFADDAGDAEAGTEHHVVGHEDPADMHPIALQSDADLHAESEQDLIDQDAGQDGMHHTKRLQANSSVVPRVLRPKDKLFDALQAAYIEKLKMESKELYRFLLFVSKDGEKYRKKKGRPSGFSSRDKAILNVVMQLLRMYRGNSYVDDLEGDAVWTAAEKRQDQARLRRLVELIGNKEDILPCRFPGCSALCSSEHKRLVHERVHGSGDSISNTLRKKQAFNKIEQRKRKADGLPTRKDVEEGEADEAAPANPPYDETAGSYPTS